jgi:hypothetical protein
VTTPPTAPTTGRTHVVGPELHRASGRTERGPRGRRPRGARHLRVVPDHGRSGDRAAAEAERLAAALARWYVEALAGRRDVRPLRDLLTPAVTQRVRCAVLREAARRHAGSPTQRAVVTVRTVRVQRLGERHEATVVVDDGQRATAVAATLHRRGEAWLVSDLARPEDGLPALPSPWLPDPDATGQEQDTASGTPTGH